jgi:nitrogenase subunit NifH
MHHPTSNILHQTINNMKQIAIYGKGGIGKSTISANLSAAIAAGGVNVMQVGCDPKHDSTRQLLNGQSPPTVLEYMRQTTPDQYAMDDIVSIGYNGVACVEAGGPEPGVGCAGRGILSTFNLLEDLGVRKLNYELILYDVLGDVVCGGFAVPIRNEYADVVYIVTSGEFVV